MAGQCEAFNPKRFKPVVAQASKTGGLSKEGNKAGERIVVTVNNVNIAFRWCPPGTFKMGSPESEEDRGYDEVQHDVTITKGFWMMETEVTVGMFKAFVDETGYKSHGDIPVSFGGEEFGGWYANPSLSWMKPEYSQNDNCPVTCVSLDDAASFCKWLSDKTGQKILLPTEAQWEYACRAGSSTAFFWGNTLNGDKANCDGNYPYGTNEKGKFLKKALPVRSYSPNAWGLYDMHGNVWERCADWYDRNYPEGDVVDPVGPKTGVYTVNRGGGWNRKAEYARSSYRDKDEPEVRINNLGFRCVAVFQSAKAESDEMTNASNKPSANKVGKLYVLSIWGTNASDIQKSLTDIQNRFEIGLEVCGLTRDSRYNADKFVQEFISLSGDKASKKNVLDTCKSIGKQAQKNDVILVYMCCHGITKRLDGDNKRYHVLFPGIKTVDQMQNIEEYGILRSEILEALNPESHRLVVLLTDAGTRENDEQVLIFKPQDDGLIVDFFFPYLRNPPSEDNPIRTFLSTNTGLVDWNSTSPFGGKDGLGEQSPYYQNFHIYQGVFSDELSTFAVNDKKCFSKSRFFNELKTRLAKAFERRTEDIDPKEVDPRFYFPMKERNSIFKNQTTQTLFDFNGQGYVTDKKDGVKE